MAKKVNVSAMRKESVSLDLKELYTGMGFEVSEGSDYGFSGSIIVHFPDTDVQIKMITPKAQLKGRYVPESAE